MIHFSSDIQSRLQTYQALLLKWQRSVNLVSNNTIEDSWNRHFIDSAQLTKYILLPHPVIMDIGSGGGFPGLVLAIMLDCEMHLVESDKKKCIFLSEVSRETRTKTIIHNDRIENLKLNHVDYITSRACASVSQLFSWTEKIVSHETKSLFLKGKNYNIELHDAKKDWQFDVNIHKSVTDSESAILELSGVNRRETNESKNRNTFP